ncbi:Phosphotransferase system, phosphocarrier protein HPr [Desulforamulus reducens MI-1]|uniref:Phosphocarrier protein HPr n=1 Tax=Desulforamulus reducens (strain ATCC BAA-1160 / DSM 100696 / MI-1) TaxID=349161 RepID=A4J1C6_DESRM|nr:HPr family phosphocarrier protein [Desulforamulus reducens]ABO48879.1 Phosphotransferase system, phosphocarrier protein HPr [Desulforamulus reducens MI-1]
MIKQVVTIVNPTGIHARPAAHIAKLAAQFDAAIKLAYKGKEIDAKSIIGVMSLAAQAGEELLVSAEGNQAEAAVNALANLLSKPFTE